MTRRGLLAAPAGLAAAQSAPLSLIKPRALQRGDTIGVIAPSSYASDPVKLALGPKTIEHFGLKLKWSRHAKNRHGYLSGTIDERIADLHDMFADPEVKGVFCLRGGYGSPQLLDRIDYSLIRRNPKVFAGYSDITALHLAFHRHAGLVTFHSPVVLSTFTPWSQDLFQRAIFSTEPVGALRNPPEKNPLRPTHPVRVIRPGSARGPLIGGNLTLICSLMGTPHEIDTRGKIFFFEDVGEEPYRIDRMLTQLRLAGKLDHAAGIIVGECVDCGPREFRPGFESTFSLNEVLDQILGNLRIPVLSGLLIGHTDDQATLPLGIEAELDTNDASVSLLSSGVE